MTQTAHETRRAKPGNDRAEQAAEHTAEQARKAISTSASATVDTVTTLAEVGQQVSQKLFDVAVNAAREGLQLYAEVQGAALDALRTSADQWIAPQSVLSGWQALADGNAQAVTRYAEQVQRLAEEGTQEIQQAVAVLGDQAKRTSRRLAEQAKETSRGIAG